MPKYRILLDPPIGAKEFGEWSGGPNIALKDKHDYVQIEVNCDAVESIEWFQNLIQDYTISINKIGDLLSAFRQEFEPKDRGYDKLPVPEVPHIPEEHFEPAFKKTKSL